MPMDSMDHVTLPQFYSLPGVAKGHDALPVPPGSRALPPAAALPSQPPGGPASGGLRRRLAGAAVLQKMLGRFKQRRGRMMVFFSMKWLVNPP